MKLKTAEKEVVTMNWEIGTVIMLILFVVVFLYLFIIGATQKTPAEQQREDTVQQQCVSDTLKAKRSYRNG